MNDKQFALEIAKLRHPAGQAHRPRELDPETALARAVGVMAHHHTTTRKPPTRHEGRIDMDTIIGGLSTLLIILTFGLGLIMATALI